MSVCVWKYPLTDKREQTLKLPVGYRLLKIVSDGRDVYAWVVVNTQVDRFVEIRLLTYRPGEEISQETEYFDTYYRGGAYHVFIHNAVAA